MAVPMLAVVAPVAISAALTSCGAAEDRAGSPLPAVATFGLGRGSPQERDFVLTPRPGTQVQVLPAPSRAPTLTPSPLAEQLATSAPAPSANSPAPEPMWSFEPSVAWVNDGEYLGVITWGSGSCPSGPQGIDVIADQEIEIRLVGLFDESDACTADISGYVTVVEMPDGIRPREPLVARVADREVTIPAVAD